MGLRGAKAKPEEEKGRTVAAHVAPEIANEIEVVRYTRERKASFIIAEAIKIGLAEVAKKYPQTRELPNGYVAGVALPK